MIKNYKKVCLYYRKRLFLQRKLLYKGVLGVLCVSIVRGIT